MDETNFIKRLSSSFKAQGPTDDSLVLRQLTLVENNNQLILYH